MTNSRRCSMDGCDGPVVGRRLCRAHYQQAWKRGDFTNAPLLPRKRNRKKCPIEHKHAESSTCYIQHQCRCDACMDHHSAMQRNRSKLKAYGQFDTGLVDAAPVREHMLMLAEFGIGYKRAAALAGIGITPARNLIWGRQDPGPRYGEMQKQVKRETADALFEVKPEISNLAGRARIPARGTHRRLQALVSIGWSQSKLADRLGLDRGNFGMMMQRARVHVSTHREVEALFDELWSTLPPHEEWRDKSAFNRAKGHAKKRRWLPPLAWDDIDNDVEPPVPDEAVAYDEVLVELALSGDHVRLSRLERREAITRLVAARLSDPQIAYRLHCADRTVWRIRQELGLAAAVGADKQPIVA